MSDDFITRARAAWRAQDAGDAEEALRRLRRMRWMPHVLMGLDIATGVFLAGVGIWLAWIAQDAAHNRLLFAFAAGVLLASASAFALIAVRARRSALRWEDETPEQVLRTGIERADASLKVMRAGRWQIAVLVAFTAALWIFEAVGLLRVFDFLLFYTPVCIAWSLCWWFWSDWRQARLMRERASYVLMLSEFQTDAGFSG